MCLRPPKRDASLTYCDRTQLDSDGEGMLGLTGCLLYCIGTFSYHSLAGNFIYPERMNRQKSGDRGSILYSLYISTYIRLITRPGTLSQDPTLRTASSTYIGTESLGEARQQKFGAFLDLGSLRVV